MLHAGRVRFLADTFARLVVLALALFHVVTADRLERPGYDSSVYIAGAESLAAHDKYEMNGVRITTHPPGLPFFLAVPIRIIGDSRHEFLVRFMPLFGAAGLLIWLEVLSKASGPKIAAAIILLVAASPVYYDLGTRHVMADLPYLFLSGCALLGAFSLSRAKSGWVVAAWGAGLVILTACAVLTRTAGVSLAIGLLAWAIWPSRWGGSDYPALRVRLWCTAAALAGLLAFAGWIVWCRSASNRYEMGGHMASYSSQFLLKNPLQPDLGRATLTDIALRVFTSAPLRAAQMGEILTRLPWVSARWYNPIVTLMIVLPLCALYRASRDPLLRLMALYFVAFMGIFLMWPFAETARFMLPISPVYLLLVWLGARNVAEKARNAPAWMLALFAVTIGAAAALSQSRQIAPAGMQDRLSVVFWFVAAGGLGSLHWLPGRFLDAETVSKRCASAALLATSALILAGISGQVLAAGENVQGRHSDSANEHLREVAQWLLKAPPGAVMTGTFPYIHRVTARHVVAFPVTADPATIHAAIVRHKIRYLVVTEQTEAESYFHPSEQERAHLLSASFPLLLRLVHTGHGWLMYEVDPQVWHSTASSTGDE